MRLLRATEEWARGRGCTALTMTGMHNSDVALRLYPRMGFRLNELNFIKRL